MPPPRSRTDNQVFVTTAALALLRGESQEQAALSLSKTHGQLTAEDIDMYLGQARAALQRAANVQQMLIDFGRQLPPARIVPPLAQPVEGPPIFIPQAIPVAIPMVPPGEYTTIITWRDKDGVERGITIRIPVPPGTFADELQNIIDQATRDFSGTLGGALTTVLFKFSI